MYNTDLPSRAELPDSATLLRSTAAAALIAIGLLVTVILPAEYGIDPTGAGNALGLKKMGEIKLALAREASTQKPSSAAAPVIAEAKPADKPAATVPEQQHTTIVQLKPGQAAEIKLTMSKDSIARYEWTATGGPVNYDTHGDPASTQKRSYHGYGKGLNANGDAGNLQAAFDGTHGWYWRNRSNAEVTVTLKTRGNYQQIKRVL